MNKKEKYENLINNSLLFTLDKETQTNSYRRESLKMVEYLYCYLMEINRDKYEPCGLEITETANRCIQRYDSSQGSFLNYFLGAWKQEYSHYLGRQIVIETRGGIKFADADERIIKRYIRFVQAKNFSIEDQNVDIVISEAMGIDLEYVRRIKNVIDMKVVSSIATNDEGVEFDLIDILQDPQSVEKEILSMDAMAELFEAIDIVFKKLQERQKPLLSKMITVKIADVLCDNKDAIEFFKRYSFIDENVLIRIMLAEKLTMRMIADEMGVLEASASRSYKNFISAVRQQIKTQGDRLC